MVMLPIQLMSPLNDRVRPGALDYQCDVVTQLIGALRPQVDAPDPERAAFPLEIDLHTLLLGWS